MKDEIKEILEFKENADYKRLSVDEIVILKDYITNLQEENEYFSDCDKKLRDKIKNLEHRYKVLKEEYIEKIGGITLRQDRIDKAIEYINNWLFEVGGNGACMDYEDIVEMKNILQGSDKDE